ncbi:MAG: hypothetical protein ACP5E2_16485 [Terracidiphilus sp.]
MARKHSEEGNDEKDKWRLRIKLKSWSHSIRQNQLLQWNEGTTKVKLFKGAEHNDLTAEFTVPKSITIHGLWNAGMQNNVLFVPELATSSAALVESSSSAICAGAVPVARSQPDLEYSGLGGRNRAVRAMAVDQAFEFGGELQAVFVWVYVSPPGPAGC